MNLRAVLVQPGWTPREAFRGKQGRDGAGHSSKRLKHPQSVPSAHPRTLGDKGSFPCCCFLWSAAPSHKAWMGWKPQNHAKVFPRNSNWVGKVTQAPFPSLGQNISREVMALKIPSGLPFPGSSPQAALRNLVAGFLDDPEPLPDPGFPLRAAKKAAGRGSGWAGVSWGCPRLTPKAGGEKPGSDPQLGHLSHMPGCSY